MFISIELNASQIRPEVAQRLVSVCPVDIFVLADSRVAVLPEQEDECTLCELCLCEAPAGSLIIHRLYGQPPLVSWGQV